MPRCPWCNSHPLYQEYHDTEWGVPEYNSQQLWEKLILDGAQAGLSWWTILSKRDNYRQAFDGFDPEVVALYDDDRHQLLMQDSGIVRNRLKIKAATTNAQAYLAIEEGGTSFSDYLWRYVDGQPIINHYETMEAVPTKTELSDQISKQLKKDGFKFVGSTIVYAYMQAVGMVNDHLTTCERHAELMP